MNDNRIFENQECTADGMSSVKTPAGPSNTRKSMLPVKLTLDVIILMFLALEYQKRAISMQFHELGGLALGCLFLVHKLLNLRWIRTVTAGIFRRRVKPNILWIVDALLTLFMAAVIITGLLISKTLPTALQNASGVKAWHYFCAALAMICTGVHLGLHWPMIRKAMWNRIPLQADVKKVIGILLVCCVTVYGGYTFFTGSALNWLSRPFVSQTAMDGMGYPGHGPEENAAYGENTAAASAEDAADGAGGMTPSIPADGAQGFGHDGKMQQSGSFGDACNTVLSYGSVILLFAVLTVFVRTGLGKMKSRSGQKKRQIMEAC